MKKRFLLSVVLSLTVLASATIWAGAMAVDSDGQPDSIPVYIDGQPADLTVSPIILNSSAYVSIRDFSKAMGAENTFWTSGTATVYAPNLAISATTGNIYLIANGRYLFVPNSCLLINGNMMVPIRTLAKAFDASLYWSEANRTVYITKGSGAILPGNRFYDETDLYWLSRIINAEARGESLVGKIAVGSVVMNRVTSPLFPDTVHDVIFDKQYGVQFTPAYSGAIKNTPSDECILAAKIVLDGGNTAGNSLYFSSSSESCWASRVRPYSMTIGNHKFYA